MSKAASARNDEFKRQVQMYLDTVMLTKQWSQSDVARAINVRSTTISKVHSRKHAMGYPKLLALAEASGIPLPLAVEAAARALNSPILRVSDEEVAEFLDSSPEWRRMVKLGKELATATDPGAQRTIKDELQKLLAKVS